MFEEIFAEACQNALEAFDAARPIPMIVGQAADLFSNKIVPGTEEIVEDGVCGFSWVKVRPARGKFVKFLKDNKIGRRDEYKGGYCISFYEICPSRSFSQSMQRKEAATGAFVQTIKKYFPDMMIYSQSRID